MSAELEHVVVTGGCGFIGGAVVRGLVATGRRVTVVDRVPSTVSGVESVVGDLSDAALRDRVMSEDVSGVVHLAAATSVLGSMRDPLGTFQDNVAVTAALIELARVRGIGRFLMSSTNAVVGEVGDRVINEDFPLRPLTAYGATKAAAEMVLCGYAGSYPIATCALRLTNVYGPGMGHKDSLVARLMRAARSNSSVQIYGDGTQRRDFVHVDDVVAAFLLAWQHPSAMTLIVGSGRSPTVLELVDRVQDVTKRALHVEHVPPRDGEMSAVIVDIGRAHALGYTPAVGLDDGLASAWEDAQARWADAPG
jgi:UDP-glucose 4-epimerase